MEKLWKLFSIFAVALIITACGGGGDTGTIGGGGTGPGTISGSATASQYFTKSAVGNTWEWSGTANFLTALPHYYINPVDKMTATILASSGGVVTITFYDPTNELYYNTMHPRPVYSMQISQSGEWLISGPRGAYALLPATFSVGETWTFPAGTVTKGQLTFKVANFGVTRTVPAGTFTDCLKLDWIQSDPSNLSTSIANGSFYFSPTVGSLVDATADFAYDWDTPLSGSINFQLQRYVAN